ncbi:hypothetical protein KIPB_006200, partial [Kipferlia bialata]
VDIEACVSGFRASPVPGLVVVDPYTVTKQWSSIVASIPDGQREACTKGLPDTPVAADLVSMPPEARAILLLALIKHTVTEAVVVAEGDAGREVDGVSVLSPLSLPNRAQAQTVLVAGFRSHELDIPLLDSCLTLSGSVCLYPYASPLGMSTDEYAEVTALRKDLQDALKKAGSDLAEATDLEAMPKPEGLIDNAKAAKPKATGKEKGSKDKDREKEAKAEEDSASLPPSPLASLPAPVIRVQSMSVPAMQLRQASVQAALAEAEAERELEREREREAEAAGEEADVGASPSKAKSRTAAKAPSRTKGGASRAKGAEVSVEDIETRARLHMSEGLGTVAVEAVARALARDILERTAYLMWLDHHRVCDLSAQGTRPDSEYRHSLLTHVSPGAIAISPVEGTPPSPSAALAPVSSVAETRRRERESEMRAYAQILAGVPAELQGVGCVLHAMVEHVSRFGQGDDDALPQQPETTTRQGDRVSVFDGVAISLAHPSLSPSSDASSFLRDAAMMCTRAVRRMHPGGGLPSMGEVGQDDEDGEAEGEDIREVQSFFLDPRGLTATPIDTAPVGRNGQSGPHPLADYPYLMAMSDVIEAGGVEGEEAEVVTERVTDQTVSLPLPQGHGYHSIQTAVSVSHRDMAVMGDAPSVTWSANPSIKSVILDHSTAHVTAPRRVLVPGPSTCDPLATPPVVPCYSVWRQDTSVDAALASCVTEDASTGTPNLHFLGVHHLPTPGVVSDAVERGDKGGDGSTGEAVPLSHIPSEAEGETGVPPTEGEGDSATTPILYRDAAIPEGRGVTLVPSVYGMAEGEGEGEEGRDEGKRKRDPVKPKAKAAKGKGKQAEQAEDDTPSPTSTLSVSRPTEGECVLPTADHSVIVSDR